MTEHPYSFNPPSEIVQPTRYRNASMAAAITVVLAAVVLGIDLLFDLGFFKRMVSGWPMIFPHTILGMLLSGTALLLGLRDGSSVPRVLAHTCAWLVILIATAILGEYWFGWSPGIDHLLLSADVHKQNLTGHISPNAAFCFLLVGSALLLRNKEWKSGQQPAQYLALGSGIVALVVLLGYLYGANSFYDYAGPQGMAIHTALLFLLLAVGILCLHPERGLIAVVSSRTAGGAMARRLLLAVIIVPAVLGWIKLAGERYQHYETSFGTALFMTANALVFLIIVWRNAETLHRVDLQRLQAEDLLRQRNLNLTEEVHRRAGELEVVNINLLEESRAREQVMGLLHQSREELADLFENAPIGILLVSPEGMIESANQAELEMLGYAPSEYVGHHISEFHTDQKTITDILARLTRGETIDNQEARLRAKDGTIRNVLISSNGLWRNNEFVHTRFFTRDITERHIAEEKLRQSEEQLQLASSAAGIGLWFWKLPENELIWTEQCKALFGLAPDTPVTPALFQAVLHPDDRTTTDEAVQQTLREATEFDVEYRTIWPDQSVHWIAASGHATFDEQRQPLRMMGIVRDITERKEIEAERHRLLGMEQQARRRAEEAVRTKDEFLAVISHELRTPLNAILGWTRLLRDGSFGPGAAVKALDTIERNARAQGRIISDLLDVTDNLAGKMRLNTTAVDAIRLLEEAIETVRPTAEARKITLQKMLDDHAGLISGDADRLRQMLWNILTNALKFTPADGKIQVNLERAGSFAQITVSDTGKGIGPEFLPFVFERFSQADSSSTRVQGGLGLGLALVRQIVEMHGGTVQAQSKGEGHGATFIVRLPLWAGRNKLAEVVSQPAAGNTPDAARADYLPQLTGLRILVVDDDMDSRELIKTMLSNCKAQVRTAATAEAALQLFREWNPQLILSDIEMPTTDGYELLSQLRKIEAGQSTRTPAIALTAYARPEDRLRALSAGFQMHVAKPVEVEELVTIIASLVGRLDYSNKSV